MNKINYVRLIIGVFVAAIIMFLTDGFLHEMLAKPDWQSVYAVVGAKEPAAHGMSMVYFAIFELGRAFVAIFLYVAMRALCGPGPKTAVGAGIVGWIGSSLTGPVQFIPLGFFSNALWLKVGWFHLIVSVIATVAGAALYKGVAEE